MSEEQQRLEEFYRVAISRLDMSDPADIARAQQLRVVLGLATPQEVQSLEDMRREMRKWQDG